MQSNVAIILAGGAGTRFPAAKPKQFLQLGKLPILAYSLQTFERIEEIEAIVLVCHEQHIETAKKIIQDLQLKKVIAVIVGGETRLDSTKAALHFLQNRSNCNVLIHDSARPLVSCDIIKNCITTLQTNSAVTVALPVTDTIVEMPNKQTYTVLDRINLLSLQTPQAFHIDILKKAYKSDIQTNLSITDDTALVKACFPSLTVAVVKGSLKNRKITYKEDLSLLEKLYLSSE